MTCCWSWSCPSGSTLRTAGWSLASASSAWTCATRCAWSAPTGATGGCAVGGQRGRGGAGRVLACCGTPRLPSVPATLPQSQTCLPRSAPPRRPLCVRAQRRGGALEGLHSDRPGAVRVVSGGGLRRLWCVAGNHCNHYNYRLIIRSIDVLIIDVSTDCTVVCLIGWIEGVWALEDCDACGACAAVAVAPLHRCTSCIQPGPPITWDHGRVVWSRHSLLLSAVHPATWHHVPPAERPLSPAAWQASAASCWC